VQSWEKFIPDVLLFINQLIQGQLILRCLWISGFWATVFNSQMMLIIMQITAGMGQCERYILGLVSWILQHHGITMPDTCTAHRNSDS
jgi:hypothetical protein